MTTLRALLATLLLLASLLTGPTPARAAQSYHNCSGFIDTIPATITTQGTWCLRQDLTTAITSGDAITIATNNVTIDCNDFKVGGLQAGVGTNAVGIYAFNRLNATVRHCGIRGFYLGIELTGAGSGGHLVEDNRFDGNTRIGLAVTGDGSLVQRNRVNTTGGSTFTPGIAYGIYTLYGVDILDNSVDGVAPAANGGNGTAYGIDTDINLSGSLVANRVRGLAPLGTGFGYAIYNTNSGRISLERNHVSGPGTNGMRCNNTSQGRAKNNIIGGFTTGLTGCVDAGGNDIGP